MAWRFTIGKNANKIDFDNLYVDPVAEEVLGIIPHDQRSAVINAIHQANEDLMQYANGDIYFLKGQNKNGMEVTCDLSNCKKNGKTVKKIKGIIRIQGDHVINNDMIILKNISETIAESAIGKNADTIINLSALRNRTITGTTSLNTDDFHGLTIQKVEDKKWREAMRDWD